MIITKKAISRRAMLRGAGVILGLPVLDCMSPALVAFEKSAAAPVNRFGAVYVPNGVAVPNWTPETKGTAFDFSPTLKPLERFRKQVLILSGLNSKPQPGPVGVHERASTRFLTDVQPKPTEGADLLAGVSVDQIVANEYGKHTQLGSLELAIDAPDGGGAGDPGFSKVYDMTISWRSATNPLPMENNPRAVFERMFGDSGTTDPAVRLARLKQEQSILDSVMDSAHELEKGIGTADHHKLGEYFEAIRDVERRIQRAEEQSNRTLPIVQNPGGIPSSFAEHVKLMYDLEVLAFQCDLTRVATFMTGHELSGRSFPEIGVPDAHHQISHHQHDPEKLRKLAKIDAFNVSLFAYFLEKMEATPDGDGSLLDHSMIVYGAGMSDGNVHDPSNLPIVLAGGGCGKLPKGRHIGFPKDTPLANLHLTLLNKLGAPVGKIGDSTGELLDLSA